MAENEEQDWGNIAKAIITSQLFILFLVGTALVLQHGILPLFQYLTSLIQLTDYQRGVVDTLSAVFFIFVFIYVLLAGPRVGRWS